MNEISGIFFQKEKNRKACDRHLDGHSPLTLYLVILIHSFIYLIKLNLNNTVLSQLAILLPNGYFFKGHVL